MPCICETPGCGDICDCGERLCGECFVSTLEDDTERNLFAGGRFYGDSLLRVETVACACEGGLDKL
jgi:hypothetical protein